MPGVEGNAVLLACVLRLSANIEPIDGNACVRYVTLGRIGTLTKQTGVNQSKAFEHTHG